MRRGQETQPHSILMNIHVVSRQCHRVFRNRQFINICLSDRFYAFNPATFPGIDARRRIRQESILKTRAILPEKINKHAYLIAWKINNEVHYALEGSVFIGGAVVQWLRDGLKIIKQSKDVEALAGQVKDNGGVYLVPAFTGLGAPYWNQHARGVIVGITRGATDAHIARAAVESIAFQSMDLLQSMQADAALPIKELRVDGGATVNNELMQFQSDILGAKVIRPKTTETTALGAAYLAGLVVGYWKDIDELQQYWQKDRDFSPNIDKGRQEELRKNWKKAVKAAQAWTEES